jgi:uncharacterized membrane protein YdjX (TVP38/TMEM64 family)
MTEGTRAGNGSLLWRVLPLALLVAAGIAFVVAGGSRYLSLAALAENRDWLSALVQRWGSIAALVYIALYAVLIALSVPGGAVLTIAGGFLFGTWAGAFYAVLGATTGATGLFVAARAGLGGLAERAGPLVRSSTPDSGPMPSTNFWYSDWCRSFRSGSSTSSRR